MTQELAKVQIENLIVNPKKIETIAVGDIDSLSRISKDIGYTQAIWNEESITLLNGANSTILEFRPEYNESISMFFGRDRKSRFEDSNTQIRVWEGDYSPIEFTKANLVKFLKTYLKADQPELYEAIQNFKFKESKEQTERLLSLDDDNYVSTETSQTNVNIPAEFELDLPILDSLGSGTQVIIKMKFQAKVVTKKDDYGHEDPKGKKVVQLRCLNAREVLRDTMKGFLRMLPESIPRYYGKYSIRGLKE